MLVLSHIIVYLIVRVMFAIYLFFILQANIKVEETTPGEETGKILSLRERYHQLILLRHLSLIYFF